MITRCENSSTFDIIILNGTVYDGTLDEPALIDIGIKGDKITTLGSLSNVNANKIYSLLESYCIVSLNEGKCSRRGLRGT